MPAICDLAKSYGLSVVEDWPRPMERKLMLMVFGVPLAALEMFLPGVLPR